MDETLGLSLQFILSSNSETHCDKSTKKHKNEKNKQTKTKKKKRKRIPTKEILKVDYAC